MRDGIQGRGSEEAGGMSVERLAGNWLRVERMIERFIMNKWGQCARGRHGPLTFLPLPQVSVSTTFEKLKYVFSSIPTIY